MPLNRAGIDQLKADLRANARHYNQQHFGIVKAECGTEMCMAGMCLQREIGADEFNRRLRMPGERGFEEFMAACLKAGERQLGIKILSKDEYLDEYEHDDCTAPIFSTSSSWPHSLADRYAEAEMVHDHESMAEVACDALDRIDDYGAFYEEYEEQN